MHHTHADRDTKDDAAGKDCQDFHVCTSFCLIGAAGEDRTHSLSLTRRLLCQLSYSGMFRLIVTTQISRRHLNPNSWGYAPFLFLSMVTEPSRKLLNYWIPVSGVTPSCVRRMTLSQLPVFPGCQNEYEWQLLAACAGQAESNRLERMSRCAANLHPTCDRLSPVRLCACRAAIENP